MSRWVVQVRYLGFVLLCSALVWSSASGQITQGGTVSVFGDKGGVECEVYDVTIGTYSVEVVHVWHLGARASRFAVEAGPGFTSVYVSESSRHFTLGDTRTGLTVCYNACNPAPISVLTITYLSDATTEYCTYLRVIPHPDTGLIESVDCNQDIWQATGGEVTVNPLPTCDCDAHPAALTSPVAVDTFAYCETVATQTSTWGRIKALYE